MFQKPGTTVMKVASTNGLVTLDPSAPASTQAVIRYNVVAVDVLLASHDGYLLAVRFRDNGAEARVRVFLREYNLNTGVTTTRMTFDSDNLSSPSPASIQFQTRPATICSPDWHFDFVNKAYYIEAYLSRTSANGAPGLAAIRLGPLVC
jgi:hypothetical protein